MNHKIKSETLTKFQKRTCISLCTIPSNRIVSHLSLKYCCTMIGMGNNDFGSIYLIQAAHYLLISSGL